MALESIIDESSGRASAYGHDRLEIRVYSDLENARTVWCELQTAAVMGPHQSFEWVAALVAAGDKTSAQPIHIVAGFDSDDTCLFLMPFVIRAHAGVRILEWFANDQGNYAGALFHDAFLSQISAGEFQHLWRDVLKALPPVDVVHLGDQPNDLEGRQNPFLTLPHINSAEPGRWFALSPDWRAHYEERFSSGSRREMRRCERRLGDGGELEFIHAGNAESRTRIFAAMTAQKRAHFEQSGIDDFFADGAVDDFYAALSNTANQPGGLSLELFALASGGEIIATNMGVAFKNRFYGLISATTAGPLRRFAPGNVLFQRVVDAMANQGMELFDCGAGSDPHKLRWCTQQRQRFHTICGVSLQGELYARALKARLGLKRKIKQSPALWPIAKEFRRLKGQTLRRLSGERS
jgi:CelD/BcsL family acetyltransferase involved in cellulose biosynthesis